MIVAGKLPEPLRDDLGCIASRANIKGFAFEYMTSGRHLAKGAADTAIEPVGSEDEQNLRELLTKYITMLLDHGQHEEAKGTRRLLNEWRDTFVKAVPKKK